MSNEDDNPWFDTHEEFDLWYNTSETMDDYKEWDEPPNFLEVTTSIINKLLNRYIVKDFCIW